MYNCDKCIVEEKRCMKDFIDLYNYVRERFNISIL